MFTYVLRASLTALLVGTASAASADVCIAIDESRDTFAPRDRAAALVLVTTQFELEGERVVPGGCAKSFMLFHAQLGTLVVVTISGQGTTWQATALTTDDLPAIYSQMVRSIVTGRPMTGLNVVDRTNVTSSQAQARRVHSDSFWYGRLGYGGVFGDRIYGTPALGFGYRAELDSFAVDIAFLNHQFSSPGSLLGAKGVRVLMVEVVRAPVPGPAGQSLCVLRRRLELRVRQHQPWELFVQLWQLQHELERQRSSGRVDRRLRVARATSLRVFMQADAVLPFYQLTSETRSTNGLITTDSRYAPSLVLSIGVGR